MQRRDVDPHAVVDVDAPRAFLGGQLIGAGGRHDPVAAPAVERFIGQQTIHVGAGEARFFDVAQPGREILQLLYAGNGNRGGGLVAATAGIGGGSRLQADQRLDVVGAQPRQYVVPRQA